MCTRLTGAAVTGRIAQHINSQWTRFSGVCFRSQRLRLARLMGELFDGFLTVVAATAMLYGLRSLLSRAIQSLRYQRLMASTCSRNSLPVPPSIHSVSVEIPSWTSRS